MERFAGSFEFAGKPCEVFYEQVDISTIEDAHPVYLDGLLVVRNAKTGDLVDSAAAAELARAAAS